SPVHSPVPWPSRPATPFTRTSASLAASPSTLRETGKHHEYRPHQPIHAGPEGKAPSGGTVVHVVPSRCGGSCRARGLRLGPVRHGAFTQRYSDRARSVAGRGALSGGAGAASHLERRCAAEAPARYRRPDAASAVCRIG